MRFLRRAPLVLALLTTLMVVASTVQPAAMAKPGRPNNTWLFASVSVRGKCQSWYRSGVITQCINGTTNSYNPKSKDGRYDPDDTQGMCPTQFQTNGCWKGYASVVSYDHVPYEVYAYVEAQDLCGGVWSTRASSSHAGFNTQTTSTTTGIGGFGCGFGHDERIHGFHEFIYYQTGNDSSTIANEWTCSKPPSYTSDTC